MHILILQNGACRPKPFPQYKKPYPIYLDGLLHFKWKHQVDLHNLNHAARMFQIKINKF